MPDNGNKTRPVRTLTVKNFSVIKDAKSTPLDFGRITVLIGPQASGKSILCKLAYFLRGEIPGIAVDSLLDRRPWEDFLGAVDRGFTERFLTSGWLRTNSEAGYASQRFAAKLHGKGDPVKPEIGYSFSENFENLYKLIWNNPGKQLPSASASRSELRRDLFVEFSLLQDRKRTESSTYIPSGRALFTDASKSILALQNPEIDQITKRFAGLIAWDSRWKAGYLTTGRDVIQEVESAMYRIAGGSVVVVGGRPFFLSSDGSNLPLSVQSSGTLELLPMFNVVDQLACSQEDIYARTAAAEISPIADISDHSPLIYLEEPEAHIFPKTQYELVKLFAQLTNDPILNFDWVITTHSPYILSAFNNLIEASQVVTAKPELRDEVAKLIPEQYWIKSSDFKAYCIHDGDLESIMDGETGLISANYLDSVSETIGVEFDELLRLGYVES
jgi:hypothetical protein